MKTLVLLSIVFATAACTSAQTRTPAAEATGCAMRDFMDGIKPSPLSNEEVVSIIMSDPGWAYGINADKKRIVAVQDTGQRYRCNCYNYLVKFQYPSGTYEVTEVEIRQGKVYSKRD